MLVQLYRFNLKFPGYRVHTHSVESMLVCDLQRRVEDCVSADQRCFYHRILLILA